jgi:UDP-N-acetylglucosamine acyltransferase
MIKIGKNNIISKTAKIGKNIIIGNNNYIGDDVIIYPKTIIGDNNKIFNRNIIGEFTISSNDKYINYDLDKCYGVVIGNNNLLHVNNIIYSGIEKKTSIGNNNKLLSYCHIGHDAYIENKTVLYPNIIVGGYSRVLSESNIGMMATIQQRTVIGQYSMVGGNSMTTRDVFPYFITIMNKIYKLNIKKIDEEIIKKEDIIREIYEEYKNGKMDIDKYDISDKIKGELKEFKKNCEIRNDQKNNH